MVSRRPVNYSKSNFLLVEPIAKTPYPPLGLLKISSMLKDKYQGCIPLLPYEEVYEVYNEEERDTVFQPHG